MPLLATTLIQDITHQSLSPHSLTHPASLPRSTEALTGYEGLWSELAAAIVVGTEVLFMLLVRLSSSYRQIRHLLGSGSRLQQSTKPPLLAGCIRWGDARTHMGRSQGN